MTWQVAIERTVAGLGYDLVNVEVSAGGLLRVFIDHGVNASGANGAATNTAGPESAGVDKFITVDDCEIVTRQLQHVLEVENFSYTRLEVSSPGLDRPLKKAADYARFEGQQVELTLKVPFQGRKKYRGQLQAHGDAWRLLLTDEGAASGVGPKRVAKAAPALAERALDFSLDEVREARLVPVVDFKGRRFVNPQASPEAALGAARQGSTDLGNGDRIQ